MDSKTQNQIQQLIAQEVNRRTTLNPMQVPTHQPPIYYNPQRPQSMGNLNMTPQYPPMGQYPHPIPQQGMNRNNLNMQINDAFMPTEDLPMFEVNVNGVEEYGNKKK